MTTATKPKAEGRRQKAKPVAFHLDSTCKIEGCRQDAAAGCRYCEAHDRFPKCSGCGVPIDAAPRWTTYGGSGKCPQCDPLPTTNAQRPTPPNRADGMLDALGLGGLDDAIASAGLSTVTPAGIEANNPDGGADGRAVQPGEPGFLDRPAWEWKLSIDPEFKAAQRPLSKDERERLKSSLRKHGCRDPIVAWYAGNDLRLVIDGHNRYELCEELHLPIKVVYVRLPDRAAVLEWIRSNQLGRRNLTAAERDELLARDYRAEVSKRKQNRLTAGPAGRAKGAHSEPQAERKVESIRVFAEGEKCQATIYLAERANGRWVYALPFTNAGGGGVVDVFYSDKGRWASDEQLKLSKLRQYPHRAACLLAAADDLWQTAMAQGKKYWPPAQIAIVKNFKASLLSRPKAAQVVAEKHGVSAATVKRAAQTDTALTRIARITGRSKKELAPLTRQELLDLSKQTDDGIADALAGGIAAWRLGNECARLTADAKPRGRQKSEDDLLRESQRHIDRFLDTLSDADAWAASDYLLDALNAWRGRHKPRQGTGKRAQGTVKRRPK